MLDCAGISASGLAGRAAGRSILALTIRVASRMPRRSVRSLGDQFLPLQPFCGRVTASGESGHTTDMLHCNMNSTVLPVSTP